MYQYMYAVRRGKRQSKKLSSGKHAGSGPDCWPVAAVLPRSVESDTHQSQTQSRRVRLRAPGGTPTVREVLREAGLLLARVLDIRLTCLLGETFHQTTCG
jgi:hypothetical protein